MIFEFVDRYFQYCIVNKGIVIQSIGVEQKFCSTYNNTFRDIKNRLNKMSAALRAFLRRPVWIVSWDNCSAQEKVTGARRKEMGATTHIRICEARTYSAATQPMAAFTRR